VFEGFAQFLNDRTPLELARDALDVLIVYYVTYRVLLLVKGTRAQHIGIGLLLVFGLYVVAQLLHLVTVLTILSSLITSFILVIVVVFQNDIRRGLIRVGSRNWFSRHGKTKESHVIDEVVEASTDLARHRIGALIAFEQDANLDEFVGVNKGKEVDAAVSSDLLVSMFLPEAMNRLHDGAVIIRNLRIAKAGVFFPMPEGKVLDQQFGSRHRAAVGITEETDAVVVVVSEERGTISCCFNGNIAPDLNGARLREMLESIFNPRPRKRRSAPRSAPVEEELPAETRKEPTPPAPASASTDEAEEDISSTLPLRLEPDVPTPSARITVVSSGAEDAEPRSDRSPPAPLRPRTKKDSDPESRGDGGSDRPPPLRPRTAGEEERPDRGSDRPPPLRPRPEAEADADSSDERDAEHSSDRSPSSQRPGPNKEDDTPPPSTAVEPRPMPRAETPPLPSVDDADSPSSGGDP
jgi:diadenylate cyclase